MITSQPSPSNLWARRGQGFLLLVPASHQCPTHRWPTSVYQMCPLGCDTEDGNQPQCSVPGSFWTKITAEGFKSKEGRSISCAILGDGGVMNGLPTPVIRAGNPTSRRTRPTSAEICRLCLSPPLPDHLARDHHFCLNLFATAPNSSVFLFFSYQ